MIALTFVGVLLLGAVGVQAALAPSLSDRWARRRLTARGATLSDEGAAALIGALNRRTRVACAGGAVAIVATLAMLWGAVFAAVTVATGERRKALKEVRA